MGAPVELKVVELNYFEGHLNNNPVGWHRQSSSPTAQQIAPTFFSNPSGNLQPFSIVATAQSAEDALKKTGNRFERRKR